MSISNNSKAIKRKDERIIGSKDKASQQITIWNIDSILTNIFEYTIYKDLKKFKAVCKKWNNLISPIVHRNIYLTRSQNTINKVHRNMPDKFDRIDAEVAECLSINSKHAPYAKVIIYDSDLYTRRIIEVFETFRFLSSLTIMGCYMTQDEFLGMISPLTQLQELTIWRLFSDITSNDGIYKEAVQLPSTLKKLILKNIDLTDNPELFIQTFNSHNSLVSFWVDTSCNHIFLEPFYKHYPSLLNFKLVNIDEQTHKPLIVMLENNPQLISLKLSLECMNSELVNHITIHLTNLEYLDLQECDGYSQKFRDINLKFSKPTKIKKLDICWNDLKNYRLDFILLNYPYLEELNLDKYKNCRKSNSAKFVNHSNSSKLKKLFICYDVLTEGAFDYLFLSCPHISELDIKLPAE